MNVLDANTQHMSTVCLALLHSSLPLHVRWRRRQKNTTCHVTVIKEHTRTNKARPLAYFFPSASSCYYLILPLPHPHPEPKVTSQMRSSVDPHLNSNHLLLAGGPWLLLRFPALEHEGWGALRWLCGKQSLHSINKCFLSSCQGRESDLWVLSMITVSENNQNNSPVGGWLRVAQSSISNLFLFG